MNKFYFSLILNEPYKEILFITKNYDKNIINKDDIKHLSNNIYRELSQSSILSSFPNELVYVLKDEKKYFIPYEILNIFIKRDYSNNTLIKILEFMNPYITYYHNEIKKFIDKVSVSIDNSLINSSMIGSYPLYLNLTESLLSINRVIFLTNAKDVLSKKDKDLKYNFCITKFNLELKDYKYNDIDLRNLSKEEIIKYLDSSVKVNLSKCEYYYTNYNKFIFNDEKIEIPSEEEIKTLISSSKKEMSNMKRSFINSFKRSLITIGIMIVVGIIYALIVYGGK